MDLRLIVMTIIPQRQNFAAYLCIHEHEVSVSETELCFRSNIGAQYYHDPSMKDKNIREINIHRDRYANK